MHSRYIPVVHPRVIELSRDGRVLAISIGAGCGPVTSSPASGDPDNAPGGSAESFGVKRPLRFLAFKLGLDDAQVATLAAILDELKTERAQAAVDDRRVLTAFADAIVGEAFDAAKAGESATLRKQSADRLAGAVVKALGRIHALLTPEQRERFAYLIRTGTVRL